jgi:hypothetical protein
MKAICSTSQFRSGGRFDLDLSVFSLLTEPELGMPSFLAQPLPPTMIPVTITRTRIIRMTTVSSVGKKRDAETTYEFNSVPAGVL